MIVQLETVIQELTEQVKHDQLQIQLANDSKKNRKLSKEILGCDMSEEDSFNNTQDESQTCQLEEFNSLLTRQGETLDEEDYEN